MKNYALAIIISIAIVVTAVILYLLSRIGRYKVQQGELEGEEIITAMETWDSKSNDTIKKLHPKIRDVATNFVNDLNAQGIKYRIYSGTRTFDEQAKLYGKGRTIQELISNGVNPTYASPTEKKVTNAKPGTSYHNYGLAFDGVEIKDGVALWNSPNESKIVEAAKKHNLYWGGNFTSFKDKPHFEYQLFGNISGLLALYNANKVDSNGYLIV